MNEELIRQYTREAYRSAYGRDIPPYNDIGKFAKELLELHHARAVAPLVEALKPFALIAELDIGDDEVDSDLFRPLTRNYAQHITVGHLRAALKALAPFQQEAKHDQL